MAEFNPSNTYAVSDRVSYNDLYYECLVDNPDNTSTPDIGLYWNEAYVKLSDVVTKAFVSSISTVMQLDNTTTEVKIYGYYFDSSVEVSIPNCTVSITSIEPGVITMDVTSTSVLGVNNVSVTKAGVPNDGIVLTFEITDQILGTGVAGTFLTAFSDDTGDSLWTDWNLEIVGAINSIDQFFVSSNAGTPSGSTGPSSNQDGTYYSFCEASNPNNGAGNYGIATTSNFRAIQSIEFDYHMFGTGMGDLTVQGTSGTTWSDLFVLAGQQQTAQGDAWLHANIPCSDLTQIRFVFNGPTNNATAYTADIALDNIEIIST